MTRDDVQLADTGHEQAADDSLLALLQVADSAFPSGGFALSHGLESLVQAGRVRDAATLHGAVRAFVLGQLGPMDTVALVAAHRALCREDWATLIAVDHALYAAKLAREARESAVRSGKRLLTLAPTLSNDPRIAALTAAVTAGTIHGTHPVVLGALFASLGVGERAAALAFLHMTVANLTGAALRLLRVDHLDAQQVRRAVVPDLQRAAASACMTDWREMASGAPPWEVAAMRHRYAETRLFMS